MHYFVIMSIECLFILCFVCAIVSADFGFEVKISNTGPVVLGANITFSAEVYKNGVKQEGFFIFKWRDNLYPQNTYSNKVQGVSKWTINYPPAKNYTFGKYAVEVSVFESFFKIDWALCSSRNNFVLEEYLVGDLILRQNNIVKDSYISNADPVLHIVRLNVSDLNYLKMNASNYSVQYLINNNVTETFNTLSLTWPHRYPKADETYEISVIIIGNRRESEAVNFHEPSTEIDIISSTNTPANLNNLTDSTPEKRLSYSTFSNVTNIRDVLNQLCVNRLKQICGLFTRKIKVKAPVSQVSVAVNDWIKHGDMLNLRLTCNGSAPFNFCVRFFIGDYKVIGNETCKYFYDTSAICNFSVAHYFKDSTLYTVLMIVSNDINKNISARGVNIYEVTKHPQLSVIVVPLTACILAIILIIFGIAFYFQNKNSYVIEVADFDFANNNDMEYKTFKERLTEAIHNAFNKPEEFSEEDSYNGVPSTSNKKYGSMQ